MKRVLALLLLAACQRAPEEPLSRTTSTTTPAPTPSATPTTTTASTSTATSTAAATANATATATTPATTPATDAGRCITPAILATPAPPPPAGAKCPKDPDNAPPLKNTATLTFPSTANLKVEAELAMTSNEIQRGLMYRTKMAEDRGMLFLLGERKEHTFWMRNTCLPLDMLFIDEDGTIVGIVQNVPTVNDDERTVGCPSLYVLEMNAGWSKRHDVKPGQKVSIPASARGK